MLIHCYLKCIEFPWKMIHSCRLQLVNNNDEPSWHLEYLHAYLALPCMREHSRVYCTLQLWQHIWKTDGFELKRASKWVISATGTSSSSLAWCFAVSAHGTFDRAGSAGRWSSLSPLILTIILTCTQFTVPFICSAQCFEEFKGPLHSFLQGYLRSGLGVLMKRCYRCIMGIVGLFFSNITPQISVLLHPLWLIL